MPGTEGKSLFFPYLSDAEVDSVKPAIVVALAPDLKIRLLHFAKNQLTVTGARHLAQRLREVTITNWVTIEASGAWQPRVLEEGSVKAELSRATGWVGVAWEIDWIYRATMITGPIYPNRSYKSYAATVPTYVS